MSDNDKLTTYFVGNVMRFLNNDCNKMREETVLVEDVSNYGGNDNEVELAFTFNRDRYYLRMKRSDLAELAKEKGNG